MVIERKPPKKWLGIFEDTTPHREFEEYCLGYLKRRYSGYKIEQQHISETARTQIDFFGIDKINSRKRFTAEAKHVKTLITAHVDQASDVYPRFPQEMLLLIPKLTEVSDYVGEYAERKNVEIVQLKKDFHPLYLRRESNPDGTYHFAWKP